MPPGLVGEALADMGEESLLKVFLFRKGIWLHWLGGKISLTLAGSGKSFKRS